MFLEKNSDINPPLLIYLGVSTYNLIPYEIGQYFNKIQCFCFEEQILNPGESVDMPVFFFIDPDVDEDPNCFNMEAVALNYTFHRVQSMDELPRKDFKIFLEYNFELGQFLSCACYRGSQIRLNISLWLMYNRVECRTPYYKILEGP